MKTLIAALSLCFAPLAVAAPACVTGTYASYQSLVGGCSVGDAVFSNFSGLTFVDSPGVPVLTPSEIMVTPSGTPTDASLTFLYLNAAGAPAPVTVNQLGQIFSFGLSFNIVTSPILLTGIEMNSTFGNTSPGSASATKTAQLVAGGPTFTSTVSDGGPGSLVPVSGVGIFLITDTNSLQAETGSATQSGFENSFALASDPPLATPEVASFAMIGAGLVFLGLIRKGTQPHMT